MQRTALQKEIHKEVSMLAHAHLLIFYTILKFQALLNFSII